jgi:hypothetical protein
MDLNFKTSGIKHFVKIINKSTHAHNKNIISVSYYNCIMNICWYEQMITVTMQGMKNITSEMSAFRHIQ